MARINAFNLLGSFALTALMSGCAGGTAFVGAGGGAGMGFFTAGAGVPSAGTATTTSTTLQAKLGTPSATYPLSDGGERLQYSQMPSGYQVFDYDFDASGRLVRQDQALRYVNFNRIELGKTRQEEILFEYGRPMRIVRVASFDGPVWDYRFSDINNPRIISVHIDRSGVVQRVVYTDIDRRQLFSPD